MIDHKIDCLFQNEINSTRAKQQAINDGTTTE
jgi:hypothetical protein